MLEAKRVEKLAELTFQKMKATPENSHRLEQLISSTHHSYQPDQHQPGSVQQKQVPSTSKIRLPHRLDPPNSESDQDADMETESTQALDRLTKEEGKPGQGPCHCCHQPGVF